MAESMESQKPGNSPRLGPKVGKRERESCQRASGAKSQYLDSAEGDERCLGTIVRRRCRKNSRFCHPEETRA